ncbi:hypothetical protein RRG08_041986 [Elysia crispata]|uniref:Uncharacterized protein n=1 Tax=Elysia crispata TaxID=231223 RepID=A0AAE0YZX9_9GAST|nr:hypothetical protein RRG08_041986 [Elysia crispata]
MWSIDYKSRARSVKAVFISIQRPLAEWPHPSGPPRHNARIVRREPGVNGRQDKDLRTCAWAWTRRGTIIITQKRQSARIEFCAENEGSLKAYSVSIHMINCVGNGLQSPKPLPSPFGESRGEESLRQTEDLSLPPTSPVKRNGDDVRANVAFIQVQPSSLTPGNCGHLERVNRMRIRTLTTTQNSKHRPMGRISPSQCPSGHLRHGQQPDGDRVLHQPAHTGRVVMRFGE